MINLENVPIELLEKEIERRNEVEDFKKWNKLTDSKFITSVVRNGKDGTTLFLCQVDDGMETIPLFIEAKVNTLSDEDIVKIAQNKYIKDSGGEDEFHMGSTPNIFGIEVEEIGRYGYELIKVNQ